MARPQTDTDAMREMLLETCEQMIRERGAITVTITDLAAAAGMSQSNIYRFFDSKEAVYEAMAERWFREFNDIMDAIMASNLSPRDKMYEFFARRLQAKRERYAAEPALFMSYLALGEEHPDAIQGYIDLADHYMAQIIAEAMADGHFEGLGIDDAVHLVNLMVQPFCHPNVMVMQWDNATSANLAIVIDTIFAGLKHRGTEPGRVPISASHLTRVAG